MDDDTPRNASPFQKPELKALDYKSPETEELVNMEFSRGAKALLVAILVIIFALGILVPLAGVMMVLR